MSVENPIVKWNANKITGLSGKAEVFLTPVDSKGNDVVGFTLKAGREGVSMSGSMVIGTYQELDTFAKAISHAWAQHKKLLPKIEGATVAMKDVNGRD